MKCADCEKPIASGTYYELDGKTICSDDYQKYRKKCHVCGEFVEGKYYIKDDKIICSKDYKKEHGDNMDCQKCGEKVTGEIIRSENRVFHSKCFRCSVCDADLTSGDTPFCLDDSFVIFCTKDYHEKYAPKCCSCKKPIAPEAGQTSAERLRVFNKDWHPQCFKCQDCQEVLNSESGKKCYPIGETPLCLDCNKKRKE